MQSLTAGKLPDDWNITPVFKKGDKSDANNYYFLNLSLLRY